MCIREYHDITKIGAHINCYVKIYKFKWYIGYVAFSDLSAWGVKDIKHLQKYREFYLPNGGRQDFLSPYITKEIY